MNVLVLLYKDVYNIPTRHIVDVLLNEGNYVEIYAKYMDNIHIRMFDGLIVKPIDKLTQSCIEKADFIYSAASFAAMPEFLEVRKYIFTFSTAFMDEIANFSDYTFTQRDYKNAIISDNYIVERDNYIKTLPGSVIGNPKFDYRKKTSIEVNNQQILFIDAGHFPFGDCGKRQEAKMLLDIAQKHPEKKIVVKPRFLKEDSNVTHRNSGHLYEYIHELSAGQIPNNLVLLNKHLDLEQLVQESCLIITPELTTSYLDIGFYEKRGLIASGFESEYTLTHNEAHINRFKKIEQRSGLCVPYQRINECIPDGREFNKNHLYEMGVINQGAAKRAVEIMEDIYKRYLINNLYPSPYEDNGFINFEQVQSQRYTKKLYETYENVSYRIDELDFSEISKSIESIWKSKMIFTKSEYLKIKKKLDKKVSQIILKSKSMLMGNEFKESYYLKAVNDLGRIEEENIDDYCAKQMFYWCRAMSRVKQSKFSEAREDFEKFFFLYKKNKYEKSLADLPYSLRNYYLWNGICNYELNNIDLAYKLLFEAKQRMIGDNADLEKYLKKVNI